MVTDTINDYTHIIYQHPSIALRNQDNYMSINATTDIQLGELLLVEHVYIAPTDHCISVISNNEKMFNMYFPRDKTFVEVPDYAERRTIAFEKLKHNFFSRKENNIITNMITKINHTCNPNCAVYVLEEFSMENTNIMFMELYSIKNITSGSELKINYGPDTGHARDFICDCGMELDQRTKLYNTISSLAFNLSRRYNKNNRKLICEYLNTNYANKILLNQYLVTKGIYFNNNYLTAYTEDGAKMINEVIKKYITGNKLPMNENIDNHKIDLFLQIINENILQK